jgi:hypothetical protein
LLMVMDVVVTSLLPSSVRVAVFGIFSITVYVKSLEETKIRFKLHDFQLVLLHYLQEDLSQRLAALESLNSEVMSSNRTGIVKCVHLCCT